MGDLSIPNSVVNIGESAFQNAKIKKLRLDLNVKTIGQFSIFKFTIGRITYWFPSRKYRWFSI